MRNKTEGMKNKLLNKNMPEQTNGLPVIRHFLEMIENRAGV